MPGENVELVHRWMDRLNREGTPPLDLCDEEIEIRNVKDFLVQGPYHGHAGVRTWETDAFDVVDGRRFELKEVIDGEDGETVVTAQHVVGRSRHTGLDLDLHWAAVWTIRGGKVVRLQGYARIREALEAVGLRR